jgi:hypothetical protein
MKDYVTVCQVSYTFTGLSTKIYCLSKASLLSEGGIKQQDIETALTDVFILEGNAFF